MIRPLGFEDTQRSPSWAYTPAGAGSWGPVLTAHGAAPLLYQVLSYAGCSAGTYDSSSPPVQIRNHTQVTQQGCFEPCVHAALQSGSSDPLGHMESSPTKGVSCGFHQKHSTTGA